MQPSHRLSCRTNRRRSSLAASLLGLVLAFTVATSTFAQSCPLYSSPHQRIGFNVARDGGTTIDTYDAARLGAGWYHDYGWRKVPSNPGGIEFHQMVRANIDRTRLPAILGKAIENSPGAVWILGNEPDRYGQDGLLPAEYATFYHDLYTFLKGADPTSRIAIAGIVQPTPIRLRYLDMVLSSYQQQYGVPMPVEIWDIHNFILPEDCGWGASIPPGLNAYRNEAMPCDPTLNEHGNINTFKAQIRAFRTWMKARGFQNTPLIISEYGILLSKYHGYDYTRVRNYMRGTFDYMLNTTDADLGYPADGNRLVQEFAWFSLNFWEFDIKTYFGLNGNLFDHDSLQIMPLGLDYAAYTQAVTLRTIDLAIQEFHASTSTLPANQPVTFYTGFVNQGGIAATDVAVQYWNGHLRAGGTLLATVPVASQVLVGCHRSLQSSYQWTPSQSGLYTIYTTLTAGNIDLEFEEENNSASLAIQVEGDPPTATPTPTLIVTSPPTPTITPGGPTETPTLIATEPTATPTLIVTTVPTTPTPTPTPSSTPASEVTGLIDPARTTKLTLGLTGGGQIQITFPAGTVDEPTTIVLRPLATLPTTARTLAFAGQRLSVGSIPQR
ncbi:MAG: hypothetical protein R2867_17240 [Caldilineaceae bacterium]